MPKRRDLGRFLIEYDRRFSDYADAPKHDDWQTFLETADRRSLAAVVRGLLESLRGARRADVEWCLAVVQIAHRDPRERDIDMLQRSVNDLAVGRLKMHRAGAKSKCNPIAWLRHLHLVREKLAAAPRGFRAREVWLKKSAPAIVEALSAIPCSVSHPKWPITDKIIVQWTSAEYPPIGERIVAFHHTIEPRRLHKELSALYPLLEREVMRLPTE